MSTSTHTSTSSTPSSTNPSLGTLSILPPELRNLIYDFLTPSANPASPFSVSKALADRIGVGTISHIPPPTHLLLASKQVCAEVRDVYFGKMVVTIERAVDGFSPWSLLGVEGMFAEGRGRGVLERMRRVRVEVFWGWLPRPQAQSLGRDAGADAGAGSALDGIVGVGCPGEHEVRNRIERMGRLVDVLLKAGEIGVFCVGWMECAALRGEGGEEIVAWELEARRRVLEPLKRLRGVRRVEGDVVASDDVDGVIRGFLGEVRRNMRERDDGGS
ncbi:putative phosphatidylinositol phospholipase c [Venturia nashicola]|uniref:Putative phosphatidylinositol phospholipase c n=1 Tax=Venturia nashicola TaxID=86259 RepID=A0A4Z1NYB8_9PEZI|nr:putative phosphatidylinositol phospholipase c [Venturia nashicola]TLD34409.1 putative phosphatidylinositol phospholipase c [Venturia nashicola]